MKTTATKSFRIDTGNSDTGVAGFVAYIEAASPEAALAKLRERLRADEYQVEDSEGFTVCVYLNADNVKIEEVEPKDDDDGDED